MSDDEKSPTEPTPPPTGLGILFIAAALALALVLSLVALIAFMAFPFDGVSPYRRHYIESFGVYPHVRPSSRALAFEA